MPDQDWANYVASRQSLPVSAGMHPPVISDGVDDDTNARWDKAAAELHNESAQQPQQPASQNDSHGWLYNLGKKALAQDTTGNTGNGIIDAFTSLSNPVEGVKGVAKGILSTASGLGSIYNRLTGSSQAFNQQNLHDLITAQGAGQDVGKAAEQVGEFFTPAPEIKGAGTAAKIGMDMAKSGAISGVQSGGDPLSTAVGTILPGVFSSPVVKGAGRLVSEALGISSGAGQKAIQRAFANPNSSDLVQAMKGNISAEDIANNLQKAVTDFRDDAASKYAQELDAKVKNAKIQNWGPKSQGFLQDMNDALQKKMKDFGVTSAVNQQGNTVLNMRHVPNEAGLKDGIQTIHDDITNWGQEARDMAPSGLDTLKKNLEPYIEGGGRLGAFAKSLYDTAKDGLNSIVPGYEDMTRDYADSRNILKEIKSALGTRADGSTNPHAAVAKIQYLLKQPTNYREIIMNKLPQGQQLLDQIAGLHLHDVAPRGLIGKWILGGEGAAALYHPASIPAAAAGAAASSPRLVGNAARLAGNSAPAVGILGNFAKKAIPAALDDSRQ